MDCKALLDFFSATFALKYLINQTTSEMRKTLGVESDFSEEELQQLHYHFAWDKLVDWNAMKVPSAKEEWEC